MLLMQADVDIGKRAINFLCDSVYSGFIFCLKINKLNVLYLQDASV